MKRLPQILIATAVVLASVSGYFVATSLGAGEPTPTKTVTINVATGPTGPTGARGAVGPTGPAGPAGAESCPVGYTFGAVVFNTPGGHQQIATCLKD